MKKLIDKIDVKKYWQYTLSFKNEEIKIRKEINSWLPEKIIDAHTHISPKELICDIDERNFNCTLSTFPFYSLNDSEKIQKIFFRDKQVSSLRIPFVWPGVEHKKVNEYLIKKCKKTDRIAVFGFPDDPAYTISELRKNKVTALKMYYAFLTPPAQKIYEIFKPEILKYTQSNKIPILLHLPLGLKGSYQDLLHLIKDFPKQKIVLAHMGCVKLYFDKLDYFYQELSSYKQVYLDTAMVPDGQVIKTALKYFGPDKIIYGSDEPICMIRSKAYINPTLGERVITEYPYHWVNKDEFKTYNNLSKDVIHCLWQALIAIKIAIDDLPKNEQSIVKNKIFYNNAKEIYNF